MFLTSDSDKTIQTPRLEEAVGSRTMVATKQFKVAGLFAGIGGLELGFHQQGHRSVFLCEADPSAREVLSTRFPKATLSEDICDLKRLPECDVLTAGFPCQDLSQVGRTKGISGPNSGLVDHLLGLLKTVKPGPTWVVLENVPFMLSLDKGRAIERIATALERMGFAWAYRVVDARAFGLPQRRRRVVILASRTQDPRGPLLGTDSNAPSAVRRGAHACGFYWTEGNTGLGWAVDSTPPLKGGSALHIPSPPAVWFPRRKLIATPTIQGAERLQGFPRNWTRIPGEDRRRFRQRWRLVGNAVSVPLSNWIARRLAFCGTYDQVNDEQLTAGSRWPIAAWGMDGQRAISQVSEWPEIQEQQHLAGFLKSDIARLSRKATAGFLSRLEKSSLRFEEDFRQDLQHHVATFDGA